MFAISVNLLFLWFCIFCACVCAKLVPPECATFLPCECATAAPWARSEPHLYTHLMLHWRCSFVCGHPWVCSCSSHFHTQLVHPDIVKSASFGIWFWSHCKKNLKMLWTILCTHGSSVYHWSSDLISNALGIKTQSLNLRMSNNLLLILKKSTF